MAANRKPDRRWWLVPEEDRAVSMCGVVAEQRQRDGARRADMRFWLDMYGCPELSGGSVGIWVTSGIGVPPLSLNVSRVIVDAARSELTQTKPRPTFLTEDGDYKQARKAKKLQHFVEGLFYDVKQYELSPRIFDHAAVLGTGIEHVYEAFGKPCVERVPRWEMLIPKSDSYTGRPRQIFRSKPYDKYVLAEMAEVWARSSDTGNVATRKLSEIKRAIRSAGPPSQDELFGIDGRESDLVMVHEGWRLPDGPKAPGRHTIAIQGAALMDDEFEDDEYPFEIFRWEHDPQFFWGAGICELLQGIQYEVNRLTMDIQENHHLLGVPYWSLPRGANVVEAALNNLPGHAIEFDGPQGAQLVVPTVIGAETYNYLWALYQKAFEIARISPQSSMGQTPLGPNASGEAQRVFEDIQNKRFGPVHEEYDNLHLGVARKLLKVVRRIDERLKDEGGFKTVYVGDKSVRSLKLGDVDIPGAIPKMFPTSMLPTTPAGKTATIEQWISLGWLTPAEGKRLIKIPDLDHYMRYENANHEFLEKQIDSILDDGEIDTRPEPYHDLVSLKLGMTLAYVDAQTNGVEEEKLDLFRQYVKYCKAVQDAANAPPPPPPEGEGVPTEAAAVAPPPEGAPPVPPPGGPPLPAEGMPA